MEGLATILLGALLVRFLAFSAAFLASACSLAEAPASLVPDPTRGLPPVRLTPAPADGTSWVLPAKNAWSVYRKRTLLAAQVAGPQTGRTSPEIEARPDVKAAEAAAERIAAVGLPAKAMWIVDLHGPASVAFGAVLREQSSKPVSAVLTFNNWPAERELVPASETLAALARHAPTFAIDPDADPGIPVFLLDSWRLAHQDETPPDDVTDNRYLLGPSDFPDPATLFAAGIDQVLYVVGDVVTEGREQDNLQAPLLGYQSAGVRVSMLDLATLEGLRAPARWEEVCRKTRLFVSPARATIVNDPAFYARAQSGFGGVRVLGTNARLPAFGRTSRGQALAQGVTLRLMGEPWTPRAALAERGGWGGGGGGGGGGG